MGNSNKDKKWQEELKGKIKQLKERTKEKPKTEKIYATVSGKQVMIEKNGYVEIKPVDEEKVEKKSEYVEIKPIDEKKPELGFKIEKENHYAVIKPIVDDIKERAKEELIEQKIKSEKIETPREKVVPAKTGSVETTIDRLIDIIEKRGSVTTFELSKELGVKMEQIENWAKILEDRGLIDMEYPLIGSSKLRKKQWKKES
jgi:hypothetical protein